MATKVENRRTFKRTGPDVVYVGRPSVWGNPYVIGIDGDREEVISKYAAYLEETPSLRDRVGELKGKTLVCWCSPKLCHADILARLADEGELGSEISS